MYKQKDKTIIDMPLEEILRREFETLEKEELVNLAILLVIEGLHAHGPKPKKKKEM